MTVASRVWGGLSYAGAWAAFAGTSRHRGARRRCLAVGCVLLGMPALAAAGEVAIVTTRIIMASNKGPDTLRGADTKALRQSLEMFPVYSSYKLVQHEVRPVSLRKMVRYPLPGERHLLVQPTEFKDDRVSLHVMLMQERKVLVNTALKLKNGGEFVVAGPQCDDGVLFLAIGAEMQQPNADGFHQASGGR